MVVHFRNRRTVLASLVLLAIVADRSWSQAIEERSPATVQASDNVASETAVSSSEIAGATILDDIWNLLNSVSDRVNTAITRAQEARDRATEARNHASGMVDNMQDGLQHLTSQMREWIEDAVAAVQQAIQQELAGAESFINGPNSCSPECEAFRDDLITLLTSVEEISNALLATSGISGSVDFSSELDLVESLPGKALYPLYRVLQAVPIFDEEFLTTMSGVASDLQEIAGVIDDSVTAGLPDVCLLLAENDELVSNVITAAQNIDKVGKGSKLAGSVLNALGKTRIAGRVGIWGWAGISYTSGLLERIGGHLESLGNRLSPIADKVQKKLQYCVLKTNQQTIIAAVGDNHAEVVQSQQAILNAVKAIQNSQGNGADLNGSGIVDIADYALFQNRFGSGG